MEYGLHVLVRLDIDQTSACIEVRGCLTVAGCVSLSNVIGRTRSLTRGLPVTIDLSSADYIEEAALTHVRKLCAGQTQDEAAAGHDAEAPLSVIAPAVLPACPYQDRDQWPRASTA